MEKQLALLRRQQRALEARDSLLAFVEFTSPDPGDPDDITRSTYQAAEHHKKIARVLEDVERGDIQFLILTMPPRHGKSELVSRRLPAWFVGRNPTKNVVVATYNDDFAADFGAEVRRVMTSAQYRQTFPGVTLVRGGGAKDRLQTIKGGMLTFVGLGGSLTGRGAHLLIIDDLIKSDKEASSRTMRDQAWAWFTKVAMTRRMGKKLVVITFTRWHSDDPIGRLTDPENEHYSRALAEKIRIINLPALAEEDDPLGRAPGEPLWPDGPDTFDAAFLEEQQALDPLGFAALYQQRPTAADGVLFLRDHIRFYDEQDLPEGLRIYCSSDHAVSTDQRRDSTVLLKVGVDRHNHIYLLDCWWRRAQTDAVVEAMLAMAGDGRPPLIWWAERGQISKSIGPFLRKRMVETETFFNLVEVTPSGDKEQRAQSISARMAMGYVHFPRNKIWSEKAVNELLGFPNGLHDDFVDALAYIGLGLRAQAPGHVVRPEKKEPRYGTMAWIKRAQKDGDKAERKKAGAW